MMETTVAQEQTRTRMWSAPHCQDPEGCDRPCVARNLCTLHYQKRRAEGTLPPKVRRAGRKDPGTRVDLCTLDGCVKPLHSHGMCSSHYRRSLRYGLTYDENEALDQPASCEACGTFENVIVEHDHKMDDLRGRLCRDCNTALGLLGEDEIRILRLAVYIVKWTVPKETP